MTLTQTQLKLCYINSVAYNLRVNAAPWCMVSVGRCQAAGRQGTFVPATPHATQNVNVSMSPCIILGYAGCK